MVLITCSQSGPPQRLTTIREVAESNLASKEARPRLGRPVEKLFGYFSCPWLDERRADLIRCYFEALANPDDDDPTGAIEAITSLTFLAEIDDQWDMIRDLIAEAPDDPDVLQTLAAGPLEGFLGRFDAKSIDRVEAEAVTNPKFRRVVSEVWKHGMSDTVWERVQAIQTTEPDPLPESRTPSDDPAT